MRISIGFAFESFALAPPVENENSSLLSTPSNKQKPLTPGSQATTISFSAALLLCNKAHRADSQISQLDLDVGPPCKLTLAAREQSRIACHWKSYECPLCYSSREIGRGRPKPLSDLSVPTDRLKCKVRLPENLRLT